jgi:hypothetical protein
MFFDEELVRINIEKLLKEAERSRLVTQVRPRSASRRKTYAPIFAWLGVHMCRWGDLLQTSFGIAETAPTSQSMNNGFKA